MRVLLSLIFCLFCFAACSPKLKLEDKQYLKSTSKNGSPLPYRCRKGQYCLSPRNDVGYLITDNEQAICGENSNSVLESEFILKPRDPFSGETHSAYNKYMRAEKFRVRKCVEAGLWCSSHFCEGRIDHIPCRAKQRGFCGYRLTSKDKKMYPAYLQILADKKGQKIDCWNSEHGYISRLYWLSHSDFGWHLDKEKWNKFCLQHRTKPFCNNRKLGRYSQFDMSYTKKIVDILLKTEAKVEKKGDFLVGRLELDVASACVLVDKRY